MKEVLQKDENNHNQVGCNEVNYELSITQKGMWLYQKMGIDDSIYHLVRVEEVENEILLDDLNQAFAIMIQKYAVLRTRFEEIENEVKQVIVDRYSYTIEEVNIDGDNEEVEEWINQKNKELIGLDQPPYVIAVIHNETKTFLYLKFHNIIIDQESIELLFRDWMKCYEDIRSGVQVDAQIEKTAYISYVKQETEWLNTDKAKEAMTYYLDELKQPLPSLNLPLDFVRPKTQQYKSKCYNFMLSKSDTDNLNKLADKLGASMSTLMNAIYFVFLQRITGDDEIVIGTCKSTRHTEASDEAVGLYTNTVCTRIGFYEDRSFKDLCTYLEQKEKEQEEYCLYPYDLLVNKLVTERDFSRNPVYTTIFEYKDQIPCEQNEFSSPYDLGLLCRKMDEELQCGLLYSTSLFIDQTITRFHTYIIELVKNIITNPEAKISEIDLLPEDEKDIILNKFNATDAQYDKEKTLVHVFEECVKKKPFNTALICGNKQLTYDELNKKANQLAYTLREKGVGPDTIVGIMLYRSVEMMVGILAIQKAGGAYLPIDPAYPNDRIEFMLSDSKAVLLLTTSEYKKEIAYDKEILDLTNKELYSKNQKNLDILCNSKNLAYIIYTSGSTGKPKGVMIEHYSVINRLLWMQKEYKLTENDVILQKTPITFDVSVWELFWWSFVGATVVLLAPGGEKDPDEMINTIKKQRVTTMHFVPSMLSIFLDYVELLQRSKELRSLKRVFTSGEALNQHQVVKFKELLSGNKTKLYNLYGPTEATVDVSYYNCDFDLIPNNIPIGKPIDNIRLYVVDANLRLQPIGVSGELCIAGDGLARGYLNRPELTESKFVDNPFTVGRKMYKTGDVARFLPDGTIEYLGRIDFQVKIRGLRIELGEVESVLLKQEEVKEAAVVDKTDEKGNKFLCAYVVMKESLNSNELRERLAKDLPEYMIPTFFVETDKLPLSPNGKLDRKALPPIDTAISSGVEFVAPRNETEEKLASIWRELVNKEQIGIDDTFFDLGGDSLKIVVLTEKINQAFQTNLKIQELFKLTTIRKLAEFIGVPETVEEEKVEKFVFFDED